MDNLLKELNALKTELDKYRPLPSDVMGRVEQKMRLEWNYNSNAIEGNSLSLGETRSLILNGITAKGKPIKDHLDVKGHDEAILAIEDAVKNKTPLNEVFIRELHKVLLKESYYSNAQTAEGELTRKKIEIGQYKTSPNNVKTSTGETFYFATPEETPAKMHDLMDWLKEEEEKGEHPLLIAAGFHYKFVRIHPFDDGNGRMARILMNLILIKHGYPPAIIRMSLRNDYINTLETADKTDSLTELIAFIGESLKKSLDIMLKAAKGENFDDEDDLDKEIALFKAKLDQSEDFKELSKTVIYEIYKENIEPALFHCLDKAKKIEDTFVSSQFNIGFKVNGNKVKRVEQLTNQAANLALNSLLGGVQETKMFQFHFSYTLKGFKHEQNPQDYTLKWHAHLNQYNYTIKIANDAKKTYTGKYSEIADFEILKKFIDEMFRELIKTLDQRAKK